MAAIWPSTTLSGRPLLWRVLIIGPYTRAAATSNVQRRPAKASVTNRVNPSSSAFRRFPFGKTQMPKSISAIVRVERNSAVLSCRLSQSRTLMFGSGRIISEMTFVSKSIKILGPRACEASAPVSLRWRRCFDQSSSQVGRPFVQGLERPS
jgi:hypothetical protein